jgi:hypothetical protein
MFAANSCPEIELRMGRGAVCLGASAMASIPEFERLPPVRCSVPHNLLSDLRGSVLARSAYSPLEHFNGFL